MQEVSLVIADSNIIVRCGLGSIFSQDTTVHVIGEATNEVNLFELLQSFHPSVVLIDFLAPGFTVETVAQIRANYPKTRVVAITTEQSAHTIVNALKAGVDSYIKKDCDLHEIIDSVKETGSGGQFFCGQILEAIRAESIDLEGLELREFNCEPVTVSPRELEVIRLIAEGYTNVQIAEKLFLSTHTVNTHRKNIMQKLGVNNTAAIVMYAVKTQLVSPNKFLFSHLKPEVG
jgi:DNA-binding NarL/FixJ family response regulator